LKYFSVLGRQYNAKATGLAIMSRMIKPRRMTTVTRMARTVSKTGIKKNVQMNVHSGPALMAAQKAVPTMAVSPMPPVVPLMLSLKNPGVWAKGALIIVARPFPKMFVRSTAKATR